VTKATKPVSVLTLTAKTAQEDKMPLDSPLSLTFGLVRLLPPHALAAWGARWIFPDDVLWDRTAWAGLDTDDGKRLQKWLQKTALNKARATARRLADTRQLTPDSDQDVILFQDKTGRVMASPNRSYGYLYVVAYLKEDV
jgi:hypothetical protein